MRTIRKGFLKEVQFELDHKGWGHFWSGGWKREGILGMETWLEQDVESEVALINAAILQPTVCAKSTAVNPHKVVLFIIISTFTNGEAGTPRGYMTSPKPHSWSLLIWI